MRIGCFIQIIFSNNNTTCHLIHVGQIQVFLNKGSKLEGTAPRGRLDIITMAFMSCCTKIYILLYTKWAQEFFFEMSECIFNVTSIHQKKILISASFPALTWISRGNVILNYTASRIKAVLKEQVCFAQLRAIIFWAVICTSKAYVTK